MHISPEASYSYNKYFYAKHPDKTGKYIFPLPEMCTFLGYSLILTIDKVVF